MSWFQNAITPNKNQEQLRLNANSNRTQTLELPQIHRISAGHERQMKKDYDSANRKSEKREDTKKDQVGKSESVNVIT